MAACAGDETLYGLGGNIGNRPCRKGHVFEDGFHFFEERGALVIDFTISDIRRWCYNLVWINGASDAPLYLRALSIWQDLP